MCAPENTPSGVIFSALWCLMSYTDLRNSAQAKIMFNFPDRKIEDGYGCFSDMVTSPQCLSLCLSSGDDL